jgi:hypothetical protein
MLGHKLEDRSRIRNRQDLALLEALQAASTIPMSGNHQGCDFVVAPLDILVSRKNGRAEFHVLELNGTGIGGVSNMPGQIVSSVAESLRQVAQKLYRPGAVLLLPVSGKESNAAPRLNKLMHEKLIFAEALQDGFTNAGGTASVVAIDRAADELSTGDVDHAYVVIGYMKDFLDSCRLESDGGLTLYGRPVVGAVNDRFCLNLLSRFGGRIDLNRFKPINGTYLAGGDKGVAYRLLDQWLVANPQPHFPSRVHHDHCTNRDELIERVFDWLRMGRGTVIKPHGTGIGHGIEFFLDAGEDRGEIIARIDHSIRTTEEFYGTAGGAFPYTLCEFVDSDTIRDPDHPLRGHRFELRVVVYRDGLALKACPTIVKVASERFDAETIQRGQLINNITHASSTKPVDGTDFILPLCNEQTLRTVGVSVEEMKTLCAVATRYVRHVVDAIPRTGLLTEKPPVLSLSEFTGAVNTIDDLTQQVDHLMTR